MVMAQVFQALRFRPSFLLPKTKPAAPCDRRYPPRSRFAMWAAARASMDNALRLTRADHGPLTLNQAAREGEAGRSKATLLNK